VFNILSETSMSEDSCVYSSATAEAVTIATVIPQFMLPYKQKI